MSCVDIKDQFLSYVSFHPHQSSYWSQSAFMKSCNEALIQVQTLKLKVSQFDTMITRNRLKTKDGQQSKMLHNLKQNIKICENHLRRLQILQPDMKTTNSQFLVNYKRSVMATLEMKMLEIGIKFKQVYQKSRKGGAKSNQTRNDQISGSLGSNQQASRPNLSRPLFIDQTQQQLMEQVAVNEYREIQKSISKISDMYKQTAEMVRMHDFMIDSIQADINQTEGHVEGGKKHLNEAYRKQSKNRSLIIKVFTMLYVLSGVYIVLLS